MGSEGKALYIRVIGNVRSESKGNVCCTLEQEFRHTWLYMGWGGRKNGVKGGMGDGSRGVAVVVKSNPRFLDENNVCCLVCEVEEGMNNICRF